MRMRKKPWAEDEIERSEYAASVQESRARSWRALFGNENPIYAEIGMGKGKFITGMAAENTSVNFVGLERQESVFALAARGLREAEVALGNVRIIRADACRLGEIFEEGEVSRIYINFCDPWPKNKWRKRRLTHGNYLKLYEKILVSCGGLFFKTDDEELFSFSVDELKKRGWKTFYAGEARRETGVVSEYETKFAAKGKKIFEIEAVWRG